MKEQTVSTVPRFLYLNAYAFLLFFMGAGIALIPLYRVGWWAVAVQSVAFIACERGSWKIFSSWKDKKRKYKVLMERNTPEFRPEVFREFMEAPCGRLLVKIVLNDLGRSGEYGTLRKLRPSLKEELKSACVRKKTTVVYSIKTENHE